MRIDPRYGGEGHGWSGGEESRGQSRVWSNSINDNCPRGWEGRETRRAQGRSQSAVNEEEAGRAGQEGKPLNRMGLKRAGVWM